MNSSVSIRMNDKTNASSPADRLTFLRLLQFSGLAGSLWMIQRDKSVFER